MTRKKKKLEGKTLDNVEKSPAVLFYTKDFYTDTMFWTPQQVGYYIRLLCVQHFKHEHLTADEILKITGTHDPVIMSKLVKDDDGRYYNVRMELEILERGIWVESRQAGLQALEEYREAKKQPGKKIIRFVIPSAAEVQAYCDERKNGLSGELFVAFYNSKGWKVGEKNKMKDWKQAVITWELRDLKEKKLMMTKGTHPGQATYDGSVDKKF